MHPDVTAILMKLTPEEADYLEELLDASDGELAPAIMRALAYADTLPDGSDSTDG